MKRFFLSFFMILFFSAAVFGGSIYTLQNAVPEETKEAWPVVAGEAGGADVQNLSDFGLEEFTSSLPVLFLYTGEEVIRKERPAWGLLGILDDKDGVNKVTQTPENVLHCTVKLRGASSYEVFDKPQFRIKLYEEKEGKPLQFPLAGMAPDSEWVLHGPFLDKTLLRNYMVYGLGREIMEWAPDTRFAEVFVNGDYQGVYLIVEPVTSGAGRLGLSDFGLLNGQTAYLVKRDRTGSEEEVIHTWGELQGHTLNTLFIDYPSAKNLTKRQETWITEDISRFEEALFSDYFTDPEIGYAKYIDVDNFVDYFLINEMAMNCDAGNLSTFAYKELNGKLKMAIWDFNNCYDNYQWYSSDYEEFFLLKSRWFSRLVEDPAFVDKLVGRYRELRKGILSTENLWERMERGQEELGEAIDRNFKVWDYTFQLNLLVDDSITERDLTSYEAACNALKKAIERRGAFLDEHIVDLYDYRYAPSKETERTGGQR